VEKEQTMKKTLTQSLIIFLAMLLIFFLSTVILQPIILHFSHSTEAGVAVAVLGIGFLIIDCLMYIIPISGIIYAIFKKKERKPILIAAVLFSLFFLFFNKKIETYLLQPMESQGLDLMVHLASSKVSASKPSSISKSLDSDFTKVQPIDNKDKEP